MDYKFYLETQRRIANISQAEKDASQARHDAWEASLTDADKEAIKRCYQTPINVGKYESRSGSS